MDVRSSSLILARNSDSTYSAFFVARINPSFCLKDKNLVFWLRLAGAEMGVKMAQWTPPRVNGMNVPAPFGQDLRRKPS